MNISCYRVLLESNIFKIAIDITEKNVCSVEVRIWITFRLPVIFEYAVFNRQFVNSHIPVIKIPTKAMRIDDFCGGLGSKAVRAVACIVVQKKLGFHQCK